MTAGPEFEKNKNKFVRAIQLCGKLSLLVRPGGPPAFTFLVLGTLFRIEYAALLFSFASRLLLHLLTFQTKLFSMVIHQHPPRRFIQGAC